MDGAVLLTVILVLAALMVVASTLILIGLARKRASERDARARGIAYQPAGASLVIEDVPLDLESVRTLLEQAVASDPRLYVRKTSENVISIKGRPNLWTWGTRIIVTLDGVGDHTRASAVASPALSTTLIDWGQSSRDIWALMKSLPSAIRSH